MTELHERNRNVVLSVRMATVVAFATNSPTLCGKSVGLKKSNLLHQMWTPASWWGILKIGVPTESETKRNMVCTVAKVLACYHGNTCNMKKIKKIAV